MAVPLTPQRDHLMFEMVQLNAANMAVLLWQNWRGLGLWWEDWGSGGAMAAPLALRAGAAARADGRVLAVFTRGCSVIYLQVNTLLGLSQAVCSRSAVLQ